MSALLIAVDDAAAVERLHELGCTDGLPVVVPTEPRVERMVLASGLDGDLVVGVVGPAQGAATVEKVAANAVMAGCLPDHFPIVVAALQAVCDPAFDLTEVQSTTHCVSPVIIVNGPARHACGPIASGFGALGPGHRANASIGRALRLCLINIGGGRPGVSDMALLGHAAKFSACLAEAEEASPFPPLHTSRGFAQDESVVTVVGVEGPHSVMCAPLTGDAGNTDRLLMQLAMTVANQGSNNLVAGRGAQVIVLNPDHANLLSAAGYDRASLQQALADRAVRPRAQVHAMAGAAGDEPVKAVADPTDLLIVVAGGSGLYSAVMPSWGAGRHGNRPVSVRVVVDPSCEIPPRH
jgi:hypothetical protein